MGRVKGARKLVVMIGLSDVRRSAIRSLFRREVKSFGDKFTSSKRMAKADTFFYKRKNRQTSWSGQFEHL